jgi:hypothetical protein
VSTLQDESPSPARQYRRLTDTYGIPEDRRLGWLAEMADAFGNYPLAVLTRATDTYIRKVAVPAGQYHEVPTPGTFAEWVYRAMEEAEREEQRALPPPPKPKDGWDAKSGPERVAFFERHVAIGKLRARAGVSLAGYDGELMPFAPDEAEIAEVIGQMRRRGFLKGTLERIGNRDEAPLADIGAQLTGRWPGAPE